MFGRQVSRASVDRMVGVCPEPVLDSSEVELYSFFEAFIIRWPCRTDATGRLLERTAERLFESCVTANSGAGRHIDKSSATQLSRMFWCALPTPDHALRACVAALRCQTACPNCANVAQEGNRWPPLVQYLRMRIGLTLGRRSSVTWAQRPGSISR